MLFAFFVTVGTFVAVVFYAPGERPMEFIFGGNDPLGNPGAECQRMNGMIDKKGLSPLSTAFVIRGPLFFSASMRQMPTDSALKAACSITVSHCARELTYRGTHAVGFCRMIRSSSSNNPKRTSGWAARRWKEYHEVKIMAPSNTVLRHLRFSALSVKFRLMKLNLTQSLGDNPHEIRRKLPQRVCSPHIVHLRVSDGIVAGIPLSAPSRTDAAKRRRNAAFTTPDSLSGTVLFSSIDSIFWRASLAPPAIILEMRGLNEDSFANFKSLRGYHLTSRGSRASLKISAGSALPSLYLHSSGLI